MDLQDDSGTLSLPIVAKVLVEATLIAMQVQEVVLEGSEVQCVAIMPNAGMMKIHGLPQVHLPMGMLLYRIWLLAVEEVAHIEPEVELVVVPSNWPLAVTVRFT